MRYRLVWLFCAALFFAAGVLVFTRYPGLSLLLWLLSCVLIVVGALV